MLLWESYILWAQLIKFFSRLAGDLQGHLSWTYPSGADPLRASGYCPSVNLIRGPGKVLGGGRDRRGRFGWDDPVGSPESLEQLCRAKRPQVTHLGSPERLGGSLFVYCWSFFVF